MTAEVFLDTNVFLYTIDEEPAATAKRDRARQLVLHERWGWSVQVANEFFVNATSSRRPFRLASSDAASLVEAWLAFPTLDLTPGLFRAAVELSGRYQISHWDACVVGAAKLMRCHTVFSEDLNDGQLYDGVKVVNPFVVKA